MRVFKKCITLTLSAALLFQVSASSAPENILIGIDPGSGSGSAAPDSLAGSYASPDEAPQSSALSSGAYTDEEAWSLILVNKSHPIPDDYTIPELTYLSNNGAIDSRVYPHLQQMFDDARSQGIYPHITSSYRSTEKQQQLMDDKINEYLASGYDSAQAKALAEEWVAIPGTSEHQLGLCVDISSDSSTGQDPGTVWWWVQQHCAEYGFIRRYPEDKTDITGIINEPWHYRYVGVHAATLIMEQGICLEEYLGVN